MVNRQELEGQWNQVKGKIQSRWGDLTDDELLRAKGNANELVGVIQQRTGETRRAVEEFLTAAVQEGKSFAKDAVDVAMDYADDATTAARQGYDELAAQLSSGVDQAQAIVRRNPMESVAVAFGAGLIAGVITGVILKTR
ncbi:MAG: CsbD family protein [Planctomycetaceae bacterium]